MGVEDVDADLAPAILKSGWLLDLRTRGGLILGGILGVVPFLGLSLAIFKCNIVRKLWHLFGFFVSVGLVGVETDLLGDMCRLRYCFTSGIPIFR